MLNEPHNLRRTGPIWLFILNIRINSNKVFIEEKIKMLSGKLEKSKTNTY